MKKRIRNIKILSGILIVSLFLVGISCLGKVEEKEQQLEVFGAMVPNKETAIKVAEAIWLPIYGDRIYRKLPFKAELKDDSVWVVKGTLKSNLVGGVPYIEIQKSDCRILVVSHGR